MASEPSPHPGRVIARLARHVELAAASLDLSLAQYRVLGILGDGREAASVLAEKLAVSRPSITGVVDGLVARGLVFREPAGDDRRRIDIGLTEAGRSLLDAADAEVGRRLDDIASHLAGGAAPALAALDVWNEALLNRTRAGICEAQRGSRRTAAQSQPTPPAAPESPASVQREAAL